MGAVGVVVGARLKGLRVLPVLDTMAPTVLVAQALGRWGNWFNQELYGKPTDLPWALEIDPEHYPSGETFPPGTTFHPTFLYEFLWCLLAFAVIVWLDRRLRLGHARVLALYVMAYCAGRVWIESLRVDTIELNNVLGLRWGVWMSIGLFVLALAYFVVAGRRHPRPHSREESVYVEGRGPAAPDRDAPAETSTS